MYSVLRGFEDERDFGNATLAGCPVRVYQQPGSDIETYISEKRN